MGIIEILYVQINTEYSSSNKKWVTEKTSLTGGTVDIDVANKTTLNGAVIDSTTGELTLDTGSLDFSDIKDKDKSNNMGGSPRGFWILCAAAKYLS